MIRAQLSEGIINLSKEFSNSFITIKVFTENIFPDLSTWGIYAKSAAAKSSSTTNVSAKNFTTKNGLNGIFIKRNSIDGSDYHASVDLSTESWKKNLPIKFSYSENLWLLGESFNKKSNNNSFFETALAIADSIIYENMMILEWKPSSRFLLIHYSDHLKYLHHGTAHIGLALFFNLMKDGFIMS